MFYNKNSTSSISFMLCFITKTNSTNIVANNNMICYFCINNYITKTNITNVYIINHNEMFYGDIRKFIERYNIIHENEEVIIDKQGRVVITDNRRKRGL